MRLLPLIQYFLVCSSLIIAALSSYPGFPQYKTRSIIDYKLVFSQKSDVTLIFISCGGSLHLKQSVQSFLYYNTYPLRRVILVDRCSTPESQLRKAMPQDSGKSDFQWFQFISIVGSELQGFQKAFQLVRTKYVINMLNKWITYDGMGYIEQAIDAIQYGQQNGIKILQATPLFPLWKNNRSLGKRMMTDAGTVFYQIRASKEDQQYQFILNNCLMNFQAIFNSVMGSSFQNYCSRVGCFGFTNKQCCQKQLGKELFEANGFIQIFIDYASVSPKFFQLK